MSRTFKSASMLALWFALAVVPDPTLALDNTQYNLTIVLCEDYRDPQNEGCTPARETIETARTGRAKVTAVIKFTWLVDRPDRPEKTELYIRTYRKKPDGSIEPLIDHNEAYYNWIIRDFENTSRKYPKSEPWLDNPGRYFFEVYRNKDDPIGTYVIRDDYALVDESS